MTSVTWADVEVGDILKGRDRKDWEVTLTARGKTPGSRTVVLKRVEDGKQHSGSVPLKGSVTLVERASPAIPGVSPDELAAAVVTSTIGGEVILRSVEGDPFPRAPREFGHPGALLSHLYIMHGVRQFPARAADAAKLHIHDGGEGYLDHTHDL